MNLFDNVFDFFKDTSQKVGSWVAGKLEHAAQTVSEVGKNLSPVYKPNPTAAKLAKSVLVETPARAAAAASLDLNITGQKLPTLTPKTGMEKFLFGEEPIKPLSTQYTEAKQSLESAGIKTGATPIAATAVFGGALLDVAGFAGGKKELAETLAKETSVEVIAKLLRKANVAEDIILPYAEKFAKSTTVAEVEKGLTALEKLGGETGKVGSALDYTQNVLKEGQDMINQSQKTTLNKEISKEMTRWYDKFYPVGQFMKETETKIGRPLTMEENAYVASRLYSGVAGKIENKLDTLGIILRDTPGTVHDGSLSTYLFNQRAIERSAKGFLNPGAITPDIAKTALKELENKVGPQVFEQIQKQAAGFYQYGNDLLNYLKDGGVISQEVLDASKKGNEFHAPFDVIEYLTDKSGDFVPTGAKAFSVAKQDIIKELKGTTMAIDDPINAMIRRTIKVVDLVERNKVAQKIVDLRGLDKSMEDVIVPIEKGLEAPAGFGKINVLKNGVKETYAIPEDVANVMKRLGTEQVDFLTKTAAKGSQALRAGATTFNLLFIIPNAWRDFQTATLVSKEGFNLMDWTKGFWEASKSSLAKYGMKVDDTLYHQYLENAGQIGGYYSTYLNQVPKTAADLTQSQWKKMASLLNPFKLINEVGQVIEKTPRLGVFQKVLNKTGKPIEAAFASREATVDFAKMGDAMRVFNMWTPFINARVQGTVNIAKSLIEAKGDPKRIAELSLKIGGLAITPFVSSYYWNTTRFPQVWDDISGYEKANNVILIYGDRQDENGNYVDVFKLPKGNFNFFIDPIQDFLEWQRGNVPNLFGTMALDSIFNVLPVSTSNQASLGERMVQGVTGLIPPLGKAIVESGTGKVLYTNKPIVPASLENVSPAQQYKANTSLIAKMVGGWLNISPLKIENAARTTFGELGPQMLGVAGTASKPGPTIPFTGGFTKKFGTAAGGQKEQTQVEDVKKYQTMMYDRKIIEKRSAQNIWDTMKNSKNPAEVKQMITDLGNDPALRDQLINIIENEQTAYSMDVLKTVSPKERAQYIFDKMKSFTKGSDAQAFVTKMTQNGIITDDTRTQLKILMMGGISQ